MFGDHSGSVAGTRVHGYLLADQPPPGAPAPTNRELARLLQAVLGELAELRAGQEELARA